MPAHQEGTDYWEQCRWSKTRRGYVIEWHTLLVAPPRSEGYPERKWFSDRKWPFLLEADADDAFHHDDQYYDVEQYPGISREFSRLKSPADVVRFANLYGDLGLGFSEELSLAQGVLLQEAIGDNYSGRIEPGAHEDVNSWLEHAISLKRVIDVWDAVLSRDLPALQRLLQWEGGRLVAFSDGWKPFLWKPDLQLPLPGKYDEVLGAVKCLVAEAINQQMEGLVTVDVRIGECGDLRNGGRPVNLLGAIWLEVLEIVTGERKQIPCEHCGKIMDVTNNRSHKRMHDQCSSRLRMRRYRKALKRKAHADKKTRAR